MCELFVLHSSSVPALHNKPIIGKVNNASLPSAVDRNRDIKCDCGYVLVTLSWDLKKRLKCGVIDH